MSNPESSPLVRLLRRFELEPLPGDSFMGYPGHGEGNLFGGFVAALAVVAAGRTVSKRQLHSLHGYFLRPGKHAEPIRFNVERLREGRTFSTRSVSAVQNGAVIFTLTADFTVPGGGLAHQVGGAPDAPEPDGLPEWEDVRAQLLGDASKRRSDGPIEVRVCDIESVDADLKLPPRRRVWLRPRGTLPEDSLLHAALLVFASDRTLLRTAGRAHGLSWRLRTGASLDHSVWLHHPPRFEDWLLYATESPVAHASRAWLQGAMYRRDGTRVVSVAQEGLLRP